MLHPSPLTRRGVHPRHAHEDHAVRVFPFGLADHLVAPPAQDAAHRLDLQPGPSGGAVGADYEPPAGSEEGAGQTFDQRGPQPGRGVDELGAHEVEAPRRSPVHDVADVEAVGPQRVSAASQTHEGLGDVQAVGYGNVATS